MRKIVLLLVLTFNFFITAQAQDATGLAKAWVQNRFPTCQNAQAAAELIHEFSKGRLASLLGADKPCAEFDFGCFSKADNILDSELRKNYLRVAVRCNIAKVALNAAYMDVTKKESFFNNGNPKPIPPENSDYAASAAGAKAATAGGKADDKFKITPAKK